MTDQLKTTQSPISRGYFGIGVEGISKPMNLGNLFRSAHAFGASFGFTINSEFSRKLARSDTSLAPNNIPFYQYVRPDELILADGCDLVGIELTDRAIDLPSFRHPRCAAYVLGPERGELSDKLLERCDKVVRIRRGWGVTGPRVRSSSSTPTKIAKVCVILLKDERIGSKRVQSWLL